MKRPSCLTLGFSMIFFADHYMLLNYYYMRSTHYVWFLIIQLLCSFIMIWCLLVNLLCSFIMLWCLLVKLLCSFIMF